MKQLTIAALVLAFAAAAFAGDDVVARGAAIAKDAPVVPLAQVLEKPDDYTKNAVVTAGMVQKSCERMGCWMEVVPEAGKDGLRVTFKDYGFFVPKDSKGMTARMEGVVEIRTLSKDEADHLESEGAKVKRNPDGTARELSFVANGVELRK